MTGTISAWQFAARRFEVNSFHHSDQDAWCYELYEVDSGAVENNYVEVLIPDIQPACGPFVPSAADQVTFTAHGTWTVPWPVFRHLLDVIQEAGDIVGTGTDTTRTQ
ncbi:hypothetical protein ACQEU3_43715 [Spirillospora sp. CA-253888]